MEFASTAEDSRKLPHLISATVRKALDVVEMICEAHGSSICNQQHRHVRCAKHVQVEYSWPSASVPPATNLAKV